MVTSINRWDQLNLAQSSRFSRKLWWSNRVGKLKCIQTVVGNFSAILSRYRLSWRYHYLDEPELKVDRKERIYGSGYFVRCRRLTRHLDHRNLDPSQHPESQHTRWLPSLQALQIWRKCSDFPLYVREHQRSHLWTFAKQNSLLSKEKKVTSDGEGPSIPWKWSRHH